MRSLRMMVCGVLVAVSPVMAQTTQHDAMLWAAVLGDSRIAPKTALLWEYHGRRAEAGEVWQINIVNLGVTRDLSKQWRASVGMGATYGYRYGRFTPRTNMEEVRPFVQLLGTRSAGGGTWVDRSRIEFRVLRPTGDQAPADADWAPTVVRLRRMDRFQHRISADNRWYGVGVQEFLVNVHPARSRVAMLEQTRTQLMLGRQLAKSTRFEAGYGLQRQNRRGGFEMNHALLLNYRTTAPFR